MFQPDIVYETGRPGSSALDCVTSGVKKVIELGYADPDHIGIQGHSWGGYETSYILTHSKMFAAVVTDNGDDRAEANLRGILRIRHHMRARTPRVKPLESATRR